MLKNRDKSVFNREKKQVVESLKDIVVASDLNSLSKTTEELEVVEKIKKSNQPIELVMDSSYKDGKIGVSALVGNKKHQLLIQGVMAPGLNKETREDFSGSLAEFMGLSYAIQVVAGYGLLEKEVKFGCDNQIAMSYMASVIAGSPKSKVGNSPALRIEALKLNEVFKNMPIDFKDNISFEKVNSKPVKGKRGRNPHHWAMDLLASNLVGAKTQAQIKYNLLWNAETFEQVDVKDVQDGVMYFLAPNETLAKTLMFVDAKNAVIYAEPDKFAKLQNLLVDKRGIKAFAYKHVTNFKERELWKMHRAATDCNAIILEIK